MTRWRARFRRAPVLLFTCFALGHRASGQNPASFRGLVTDKSTGKPVGNAQVTFVEVGRTTATDSLGRFHLGGLPSGEAHLSVRAAGFPRTSVVVNLVAAGMIERTIALDSTASGWVEAAQPLPGVAVTAPATPVNYRLVDFERRRALGRGQYLTEDEIVKSGAYSVADAVKNMRGVIYECGGNSCFIHMARAPMRCQPEFIVDDQVMNDFGPTTPIRDIVGLEVYTGPTEVPGEYAGRYAGCGVVVIWTRSGPTRKR